MNQNNNKSDFEDSEIEELNPFKRPMNNACAADLDLSSQNSQNNSYCSSQ